jgi:hypothetical protein
MWKLILVIMVAAVTVRGGVTTVAMTIPCTILARFSVESLIKQ